MAVISMIMALKVQYARRMVKEMTITMAWNIKLTGKTPDVSYLITPRCCHIVASAGQN